MNPVLGHLIALALLAVPVFFAGRYCFRDIRSALTTGSCGDCSGDCGSCGGGCGCGEQAKTPRSEKKDAPVTRYAVNGEIVKVEPFEKITKER